MYSLKDVLKKQSIELTSRQEQQFQLYFAMLVDWNKKMNLTAITDHDGVYRKHFYDSLTIAFDFPFNDQSLCDVGAGAGFPSIPLKIVYPELKVTIVDSLGKRITFLKHLIEELDLKNVNPIHARAEEFAKDHRESFDLVTARAVARLNILDELCLPLVKKEGYFLVLKGKAGADEYAQAEKGITQLGGKLIRDHAFALDGDDDHRHNLIIKKIQSTPKKYPRSFGTIKKKPL